MTEEVGAKAPAEIQPEDLALFENSFPMLQDLYRRKGRLEAHLPEDFPVFPDRGVVIDNYYVNRTDPLWLRFWSINMSDDQFRLSVFANKDTQTNKDHPYEFNLDHKTKIEKPSLEEIHGVAIMLDYLNRQWLETQQGGRTLESV